MSTRRPAPERRLDPVGPGRRQGRRPRRLAARVGVVAGLLLGAALAATAPGLLAVALVIALAWPVTAGVTRRRAAVRRLAIRRDAAPAVLDLLGAALLAGLNPH
jgi:Flp pilus assembly protein TadB